MLRDLEYRRDDTRWVLDVAAGVRTRKCCAYLVLLRTALTWDADADLGSILLCIMLGEANRVQSADCFHVVLQRLAKKKSKRRNDRFEVSSFLSCRGISNQEHSISLAESAPDMCARAEGDMHMCQGRVRGRPLYCTSSTPAQVHVDMESSRQEALANAVQARARRPASAHR